VVRPGVKTRDEGMKQRRDFLFCRRSSENGLTDRRTQAEIVLVLQSFRDIEGEETHFLGLMTRVSDLATI
jgi:hypothetical protein